MNERLYRSVDDRVIAGVCGGLAARFAIDPSLVRVAYAVGALVTGIFPFLILYVIMAVVVPEEPSGFAGGSPTPPGPDGVAGWTPPTGPGAAPAPWGEATPPASAAPEPSDATSLAPGSTAPAGAGPEPAQWATPAAAPSGRRATRANDRLLGVIGGVVLVALGIWFLVRDRLEIDWGVVWAAGLMALGVVIVIAAFRPRR